MTPHTVTLTSARTLTAVEFEHFAAVPPAVEWFANIRNGFVKLLRVRRS
jgi:hypothetical protein